MAKFNTLQELREYAKSARFKSLSGEEKHAVVDDFVGDVLQPHLLKSAGVDHEYVSRIQESKSKEGIQQALSYRKAIDMLRTKTRRAVADAALPLESDTEYANYPQPDRQSYYDSKAEQVFKDEPLLDKVSREGRVATEGFLKGRYGYPIDALVNIPKGIGDITAQGVSALEKKLTGQNRLMHPVEQIKKETGPYLNIAKLTGLENLATPEEEQLAQGADITSKLIGGFGGLANRAVAGGAGELVKKIPAVKSLAESKNTLSRIAAAAPQGAAIALPYAAGEELAQKGEITPQGLGQSAAAGALLGPAVTGLGAAVGQGVERFAGNILANKLQGNAAESVINQAQRAPSAMKALSGGGFPGKPGYTEGLGPSPEMFQGVRQPQVKGLLESPRQSITRQTGRTAEDEYIAEKLFLQNKPITQENINAEKTARYLNEKAAADNLTNNAAIRQAQKPVENIKPVNKITTPLINKLTPSTKKPSVAEPPQVTKQKGKVKTTGVLDENKLIDAAKQRTTPTSNESILKKSGIKPQKSDKPYYSVDPRFKGIDDTITNLANKVEQGYRFLQDPVQQISKTLPHVKEALFDGLMKVNKFVGGVEIGHFKALDKLGGFTPDEASVVVDALHTVPADYIFGLTDNIGPHEMQAWNNLAQVGGAQLQQKAYIVASYLRHGAQTWGLDPERYIAAYFPKLRARSPEFEAFSKEMGTTKRNSYSEFFENQRTGNRLAGTDVVDFMKAYGSGVKKVLMRDALDLTKAELEKAGEDITKAKPLSVIAKNLEEMGDHTIWDYFRNNIVENALTQSGTSAIQNLTQPFVTLLPELARHPLTFAKAYFSVFDSSFQDIFRKLNLRELSYAKHDIIQDPTKAVRVYSPDAPELFSAAEQINQRAASIAGLLLHPEVKGDFNKLKTLLPQAYEIQSLTGRNLEDELLRAAQDLNIRVNFPKASFQRSGLESQPVGRLMSTFLTYRAREANLVGQWLNEGRYDAVGMYAVMKTLLSGSNFAKSLVAPLAAPAAVLLRLSQTDPEAYDFFQDKIETVADNVDIPARLTGGDLDLGSVPSIVDEYKGLNIPIISAAERFGQSVAAGRQELRGKGPVKITLSEEEKRHPENIPSIKAGEDLKRRSKLIANIAGPLLPAPGIGPFKAGWSPIARAIGGAVDYKRGRNVINDKTLPISKKEAVLENVIPLKKTTVRYEYNKNLDTAKRDYLATGKIPEGIVRKLQMARGDKTTQDTISYVKKETRSLAKDIMKYRGERSKEGQKAVRSLRRI